MLRKILWATVSVLAYLFAMLVAAFVAVWVEIHYPYLAVAFLILAGGLLVTHLFREAMDLF